MFDKILIANRGEIALRVLRTCRDMGIRVVCVYSEVDRDSSYVKLADEAVCIGPTEPSYSYLNGAAIIAAAEVTGAEAIHPGYGFLSENAEFAEQVRRSGFNFIGPNPETIRIMGDKKQAKKKAAEYGLKLVDSADINLADDISQTCAAVAAIGYPVILKSAAGGGGRGMRVIHTEAALRNSVSIISEEALRSFGDGTVYAERLLSNARHIEVQVLADKHGNAVHLGTRDCSVQRRHQKIIEEAPAPGLSVKVQAKLGAAVVAACSKLGYIGIGTFEFLFDGRNFYFIEMNTRIQVEHPVTEMITGLDLVELQLQVAAGEKLPFRQKEISFAGHAIECRINAEDPINHVPAPGTIIGYHPSGGVGVRVDSHVYGGYQITHHYDSLIGKLIVCGRDRAQALARMRRALGEFIISGIKSNLNTHQRIMADPNFIAGQVDINYLSTLA